MRALNGYIGISPISASKHIEKKRIGGMEVPVQSVGMLPAKVLFGSKDIPSGSTVYLPGDAAMQHWAKQVYNVNGVEFVRAPETAVFFVEEPVPQKVPYTQPPPTPMPSPGVPRS